MISIPCNHPDLEEFIDLKTDLNKVTKANISIRITDDFMVAVKNRQKYKLSFVREATGEEIIKEVDAYEIFHKICKANWDYAEPGMLFWNTIENWNLLSADKEFQYGGVNPCFGGQAHLLTVDGYKTFEELCDTEPYIININGEVVKSKVWCSGEKETVKVKANQLEIICTPEHRFMTIDGYECMAKDLKGKKLMPLSFNNRNYDTKYIKYGFIQGDGQLNRLNDSSFDGLEVNIGYKDTDIYDLFSNEQFTEKSDRAIYLQGYTQELLDLGFSKENLPCRLFPSSYNSWTKMQKASFLQGCYSANGCVIQPCGIKQHGRIAYKTTCKEFAEQLVQTLKNDFGIEHAYITTNKAHKVKFNNGEYECKESYDVNIARFKEIGLFISMIGFYQQYKKEQMLQMIRINSYTVGSVTPNGIQKVYDFTEPEKHWGIVDGVAVHNCAEEPLPPGGSCLLGSLNLSEFVTDNTFNFDVFKQAIIIAVRGLNAVLDEGMPLHPLQEQRESVRDWRQIGLGIFGLADMLIKLQIPYGSPESLDLCDKIGFMMAYQAIKASNDLAIYSQPYPKYNKKTIEQSAYFIAHTEALEREDILFSGLRNSQLLTIAPTGTLSTMLGVSGGIEPIFANSYTRKTESLHGHDEYYKVYTPIVEQYMKEHALTDESQLPEWFVTAPKIDYKDRIHMQAVWQKHIDASISSTVNLPNSATVQDVEKLYFYAWEKGLKGITIFRDGCKRTGILTTDKKEENTDQTNTNTKKPQLKRGMILKVNNDTIGKERHLQTGCGTLHMAAFFDPFSGDLLECYLSKGSQGGCQSNLAGISRMISLSARGGIDVYSIADQLHSCPTCPAYAVRHAKHKDTSKGDCCPSAIANALIEMYEEMKADINDLELDGIEDIPVKESSAYQEESMPSLKCPECGEDLIMEGGCMVCHSCGYSKCE